MHREGRGLISVAGFVLAGGRSSRMGKDKALLPLGKQTLLEYVANEVSGAVGSVCLVGRRSGYEHLGFPILDDLHPGEGPVGAVITALKHSQAEWNLIVACDMPNVAAPFLGLLIDAATDAESMVLMPESTDGMTHPLCAVYQRTAVAKLEAEFTKGVRQLHQAVRSIGAATFRMEESDLLNVNTPVEWDHFQASVAS